MDIYVQSRGVSQGYRWLKLTGEGQERVDPPLIDKVNVFLDSDDFSLVLGRFNGKLILLVTGLETSQRTDNRTRKIRNSVAWVGENSDEPVLRTLAIQALKDELRATIDSAVQSGGKEGFEVPFRERPKLTPIGINGNLQTSKVKKIGNLEELKTELVKELSQCSLPERDGILVVVSGLNKREDFEKAGVWWGLSNIIDSEDTEYLKYSVNQDSENLINFLFRKFKQLRKGIAPAFLLLMLITSLAVNGLLYQKLAAVPNQQKQLEALKKDNEELENKLNSLEQKLKVNTDKNNNLQKQLNLKDEQVNKYQNVLEDVANRVSAGLKYRE